MLTLSVLAGVFIALGAAAFTAVLAGTTPGFGPARLLGGIIFSTGLILVVVAGAELFTGNTLIVMAWVDRRVEHGGPAAQLGLCLHRQPDRRAVSRGADVSFGPAGRHPRATWPGRSPRPRSALGPMEAFTRGILCNMLVCLAVWLTFAARERGRQDPGDRLPDLGLRAPGL